MVEQSAEPTPEMMVKHLDIQVNILLRENERLRAALHDIGAMFFMEITGDICWKPGFENEDILNAVNRALEE